MLIRVAVLGSDRHFVTTEYLLRWSGKAAGPMRALTPGEAHLILAEPSPAPPARLGAEPQAWANDGGRWWPVMVVGTDTW